MIVDDVDFFSADPDGWRRAGRAQLEEGVTAYCPTLVTAPLDEYGAALERAQAARSAAEDQSLPTIVGVHLEGPFLGGAPGAHPVALVRPADCEWLRAVLAASTSLSTAAKSSPRGAIWNAER